MAGGGAAQYVPPAMGVPDGVAGSPLGGIIPEMTKLREWETQHEEELEESARKEELAKKDTREKASDELAKWYQDRQAELAKRLEVNRAQEQEMEAARPPSP